ncbi:anti-sigma factor antagonist [Nocardia cyriacigeorgica]|uniref:anti-sigma factor antagonist n=1 Tax=Nocardia cyriacigeorgica TaxID=135487 RepID=UPI00245528C6|nr:anti-sigma factor antagonist [Nocardia cyriacigeorgica]
MPHREPEPTLSATPPPTGTILHIEPDSVGRAVVLRASGEVDILTAPRLRSAIDQSWKSSTGVTTTVVDLTDVSFLASAGLAVLAECARSAPSGVQILIVANSAATLRPIKLVGLAALLDVHPTVDEAMTGL